MQIMETINKEFFKNCLKSILKIFIIRVIRKKMFLIKYHITIDNENLDFSSEIKNSRFLKWLHKGLFFRLLISSYNQVFFIISDYCYLYSRRQ